MAAIGTKKIGKSGFVQATIQGPEDYDSTTGITEILPCAAIENIMSCDNTAGFLVVPSHANAPGAMPNMIVLKLYRWNTGDGGYWEEVPDETDLSAVYFKPIYTQGAPQRPFVPSPP